MTPPTRTDGTLAVDTPPLARCGAIKSTLVKALAVAEDRRHSGYDECAPTYR